LAKRKKPVSIPYVNIIRARATTEYTSVTTPYSDVVNNTVYNGTRHQFRKRPTMLLSPYMAVSLTSPLIPAITHGLLVPDITVYPNHTTKIAIILTGNAKCQKNDVTLPHTIKNKKHNLSDMRTKYQRVLLKLSGESLMGTQGYGIDTQRLNDYATQIKEIVATGVQVAIVIGGGNIFRGLTGASRGFDRVKGDQMGMLATVINSLALSSALTAIGQRARVFTAINMFPIGEHYSKWKAIEALDNGEVAIISGGTGNPFFTTDTGSALRAVEVEAQVMLKGTRVDGIYTADPEKDPTATKFSEITYDEVYNRGLKVMDLTATALCKENRMPIVVFDMDTVGNLEKVIAGEPIGTLVY
jgi:uridylate kinase